MEERKKRFEEVIVNNEKIYLRKSWNGWKVIKPIKDENNKIIWSSLFTTDGFITLGFVLLTIFFLWLGFKELIGNYYYITHNTAEFCKSALANINKKIYLNLTGLP